MGFTGTATRIVRIRTEGKRVAQAGRSCWAQGWHRKTVYLLFCLCNLQQNCHGDLLCCLDKEMHLCSADCGGATTHSASQPQESSAKGL